MFFFILGKVSFETLDVEAVEKYQQFLCGSMVQFEAEYDCSKATWRGAENMPENALDALEKCDKAFFPIIHTLLRMFVTLPVTTASGERGFFTMKRVRTYLRSSMGQERFSGLCHLNINRDIQIPVNTIVKKFAKTGQRRAHFGM